MGDAGYFTPRVRTEAFLEARDKDEPQPQVSILKNEPFCLVEMKRIIGSRINADRSKPCLTLVLERERISRG